MTASLLPPARTATEEALEQATARVGGTDVPVDRVMRPETCPEALLPWLAWALSVDVWDAAWSEDAKRRSIAEAIPLHRTKGTVSSVRRALRGAGYGEATLIENQAARTHDGTLARDGAANRERADHWAEYRLVLSRPVTIRQAAQARAIIAATAPARCHLKLMDFTEVAHLRNGTILRDGANAYGAA